MRHYNSVWGFKMTQEIPGTRKLHRLDENIGSVDIQLTAEDLNNIQEAMANIAVVGHRH